ncbi:hypothetical protein [Thalassospira sp.]|uniref:hypothetical protein n=1 Tax=Thalassospira sp. TaxID=1912094 RepID=UPI003AA84C99
MIELQDHRIFSLHSLSVAAGKEPGGRFSELVKQPLIGQGRLPGGHAKAVPVPVWLPERCRAAAKGKYADMALLQEKKRSCGDDLYEPVRQLLSGEVPRLCRIYSLADAFRRFLENGVLYEESTPPEERYQYKLAMVLSDAARKRVEKEMADRAVPDQFLMAKRKKDGRTARTEFAVPVDIEDFDVYRFATGRMVCKVSLKVAGLGDTQLPAPVLTELINHVGRFAKLGWIEYPPSILVAQQAKKKAGAEGEPTATPLTPALLDDMDGFTLGSFVNRIVQGAGASTARTMRTHTHAYAALGRESSGQRRTVLEEFGRKLARQYTSDYALSVDADGIYSVTDFDNVVHILSREGAASIVDPFVKGEEIPFLNGFRSGTFEKNYLPVSILNLHQHARSLDLLTLAVQKGDEARELDLAEDNLLLRDAISDERSILSSWDKMQDDVTLLNSRFRFHQISAVSMHNRFSKAQRLALGLDELEKQLSSDLADMSMRVQALVSMRSRLRQRRFDRWFGWVPILGSGVVAGIFFLEIITAFFDLRDSGKGFDALEIAALAVTVVLIASAMIFTYRQRRMQH